jgi:hypothetical protein
MKPQDFDEPRCKCEDNVDVSVLILCLNDSIFSPSNLTQRGMVEWFWMINWKVCGIKFSGLNMNEDVLKNAVFWVVAPCRSCVNRRFGGTYRLHLQLRNQREQVAGSHLVNCNVSGLIEYAIRTNLYVLSWFREPSMAHAWAAEWFRDISIALQNKTRCIQIHSQVGLTLEVRYFYIVFWLY